MIQTIKFSLLRIRYRVRLIIAGSRACPEQAYAVDNAIEYTLSGSTGDHPLLHVDLVISGTAGGGDTAGELWAKREGIPIARMPANWEKHGKRAGYLRNEDMARVATHTLILWDGESKGSLHMRNISEAKKLPTYVYRF